jgi:hypothetical protein
MVYSLSGLAITQKLLCAKLWYSRVPTRQHIKLNFVLALLNVNS